MTFLKTTSAPLHALWIICAVNGVNLSARGLPQSLRNYQIKPSNEQHEKQIIREQVSRYQFKNTDVVLCETADLGDPLSNQQPEDGSIPAQVMTCKSTDSEPKASTP